MDDGTRPLLPLRAAEGQTIDFNIFEGITCAGVPSHTISQGKLIYANGKLDVQEVRAATSTARPSWSCTRR